MEADVLGVQGYSDAGFNNTSEAFFLQDKSSRLPHSTYLAMALPLLSPIPVLMRSAKRSFTFVEPFNKSDIQLDISGDNTMLDRIYIPQKPVEDTEEMEYTEVEKETHSITAENQNNNYDLHPSIMKIGTVVYEVSGKSMPFHVKPHQNICTGCRVKTTSK